MSFTSKEFKKLQKEWYAKLKNSGFEEIEDVAKDRLIDYHRLFFHSRCQNLTLTEAKIEYYRVAGHFLHEHQFSTPTAKTMWELHSNGKSLRDIGKVLKINRNSVWQTVNALQTQMFKNMNDLWKP